MNRHRPKRPYPLGIAQLLPLLLLLSGVGAAIKLVTDARQGEVAADHLALAATSLGTLGLLAVRLFRLGVYVTADGLRVINLLKTHDISWSEIRTVELRRTGASLLGTMSPFTGQTVWIGRKGAPAVPTTISSKSVEHLGAQDVFEEKLEAIQEAWKQSAR